MAHTEELQFTPAGEIKVDPEQPQLLGEAIRMNTHVAIYYSQGAGNGLLRLTLAPAETSQTTQA